MAQPRRVQREPPCFDVPRPRLGLQRRWALGRPGPLWQPSPRGDEEAGTLGAQEPRESWLQKPLLKWLQERHWYRIPKDLTIATAATMVVK